MKRLALLSLIFLGPAIWAFDGSKNVPRVVVLDPQGEWDRALAIEETLSRYVVDELRARDIDAVEARLSFEEAEEIQEPLAEILVELVAGDASTSDYGGVGVGDHYTHVSLGLLVSRLQARVRVYDGSTLELIGEHELFRRSTALLPTAVGTGTRSLFAVIALPFVERAQVRRVARAAARDAVEYVAKALP